MLEYRRYREAADDLRERFADGRRLPLPVGAAAARAAAGGARRGAPVYEPELLASAIGDLLRTPPRPDTSHIRPTVSLERRLGVLRELLAGRAPLDFDEAFGDEDRLTQAVTLFALLEMHKRGEASWEQGETFGPIR